VRIARARKIAALILAILPSVYGLLILVAFSAGIDLAARAIEALGLGMDSGPAGVAVLTVLIVMVAFALGTLLFTATAIIYAPQVVMFVGLTRATMGLDRVRPGGDHDPDHHGPERQRFRWLTRPMLLGFALGALVWQASWRPSGPDDDQSTPSSWSRSSSMPRWCASSWITVMRTSSSRSSGSGKSASSG
jgi:hypothetical protein